MSTEAFQELVGAAKADGFDPTAALKLLDNLDWTRVLRVLRSAEMKRLLMSTELREAVDAANISQVSELYTDMYESMRQQKIESITTTIGEYIGVFLGFGIPVLLIITLLGCVSFMVIKRFHMREIGREEKRRLKQLKRENAEAQRRKTPGVSTPSLDKKGQ